MKINQLNPNTVRQASDRELNSLHFRLHQLASPYLHSRATEDPKFQYIAVRHRLIGFEMIRRGLRFKVGDELDRLAFPEIEIFLERFVKLIPGRLGELSKIELIRLHNQIHSVWEIVHIKQPATTQQEQLWNWHRMVERELERRDIEPPRDWDSLDRPLGRALATDGIQPSGNEMGEWMFLEDLLPLIPSELVIKKQFALVDSDKGLIWMSDEGGRQLIKVIYFRILRQFPREEWARYKPASLDDLKAVDVAYDLTLVKLDPLWTVQLSMQFNDLCLVKPYLYIVGGMANQGASKNDIDILLRNGLEKPLEDAIYLKFVNSFAERYRTRFTQVEDSGLSPFTSYIGVYSLNLVRSEGESNAHEIA